MTGQKFSRPSYPSDSTTQGKLLVTFEGAGKLDSTASPLCPRKPWKHTYGLRTDLVQNLADLHPGFLRFPGGCIVEGNQSINRYQWKHTIGDMQNAGLQKISGTTTLLKARPRLFPELRPGIL